MPRDLPEFVENLRARCEREKITNAELARRVDVSAQMISQIMKGDCLPSLPLYAKIAEALGFKVVPLITKGAR